MLKNLKIVEDLFDNDDFNIQEYEGYVYMTHIISTGQKYIGKKTFFHRTNVKLGKKELANLPITRGKRPSKKLVIKESDWKTYYGSSAEVKKIIKTEPKEGIVRKLLRLCTTKKELTYYECKYMFDYDVLLPNSGFLNDNILGKFFTKDLAV